MTAAARSRHLLDLLAQVPDPRKRRGRRYPLAGLLAVGIAAVIAGSRSFAAIGQWAAEAGPAVLAGLGAARGPAEESTFRRAFALVSPDVLDQVLGAWLWTRAVRAGGRLVIAVDGKAVRGAKNKEGKAPSAIRAGDCGKLVRSRDFLSGEVGPQPVICLMGRAVARSRVGVGPRLRGQPPGGAVGGPAFRGMARRAGEGSAPYLWPVQAFADWAESHSAPGLTRCG
jgi:hypothetical protein